MDEARLEALKLAMQMNVTSDPDLLIDMAEKLYRFLIGDTADEQKNRKQF